MNNDTQSIAHLILQLQNHERDVVNEKYDGSFKYFRNLLRQQKLHAINASMDYLLGKLTKYEFKHALMHCSGYNSLFTSRKTKDLVNAVLKIDENVISEKKNKHYSRYSLNQPKQE